MRQLQTILTTSLASLVLLAFAQAAGAALPTIAAGGSHSCGAADNGAVYCWGDNSLGQLGDGTTTSSPVPVKVVGLPAAANGIAAGRDSTCAMLVDRSVWCWGGNTFGQLGNGMVDVLLTPHPTPAAVPGINNAARLSGGDRTFCAALYAETAACWGSNDYGLVGNPAASPKQSTPIGVIGLVEVRSVSVGYQHACAVINDGTVDCWGDNTAGKLGDGSASPSATPVPVGGLATAASAFAGGATTCAIVGVGTAKCWGAAGLIGDGSPAGSPTPRNVSGIDGAPMLGGSATTNCAVNGGQTLACWGTRPGNGSPVPTLLPVQATAPPGVVAVTGNGLAGHICLLARGGGVSCWGESNAAGQLGNGGVSNDPVTKPTAVVGLDLVTGVYTSTQTSLLTSGRAKFDRRRRNLKQKFLLRAKLPMLIGPVDGCSGRASVATSYSLKKRKRTIRASAQLKFEGDSCVAKVTLKLPAARFAGRRIRATANWPGNGSIAAIKATSKRFVLPRAKSRRR
jgi:hypothetical protein